MRGFGASYELEATYDEVFEAPGVPRPHCRELVEALERLGEVDLADARRRADLAFVNAGITFTVYSESTGIERIFPFDLVPRVIDGREWERVERGLKQRVMALNAFIQDIYNERRIITAGLVPAEAVLQSRNYQPAVEGFTPPSRAWVHSACSVYMPAPSACRHTTLRSGQATAAPVAQGKPWPIAPPVFCSQSMGAALKVGANSARPYVTASSETMQFSGSSLLAAMPGVRRSTNAALGLRERLATILPLPKGEGRGEGKEAVRCHLSGGTIVRPAIPFA